MRRFLPLTVIVSFTSIFLYLCVFVVKNVLNDKNDPHQQNVFQSFAPIAGREAENGREREEYERLRLRDPQTGHIPDDIRAHEIAFATTLPTRESNSQHSRHGGAVQSLDWEPRGPYGVGGRTRALVVDVTNEQIMVAAGVSGGLWRTENGGNSWQKITPPDQWQNFSCIIQDTRPGKQHIWYAGTGEYIVGLYGDGIFRSEDGARTWRQLPSTIVRNLNNFQDRRTTDFGLVWRLVIDHTNLKEDVVYAATFGRIYRSADGGASWNVVLGAKANSSAAAARYTDVAITRNGTLYASISSLDDFGNTAIASGLWRSTDGMQWRNITPKDFPRANLTLIAPAPSNDNTVYFLVSEVESYSFFRYAYLSGDGAGNGGEWQNRSRNLPSSYNGQGGYCVALKIKPDEENTVFLGGIYSYRSFNGFAVKSQNVTTNTIPLDLDEPVRVTDSWADHHDFVFLPSNPNVMLTLNDGGIWRTNDCMSDTIAYTSLNNGYRTTQFYTVAINHAVPGDNTVMGGLQDRTTYMVRSTKDVGYRVGFGDGYTCAISENGKKYYTSSQYAILYRFELDSRGNRTRLMRIDPFTMPFEGARYFLLNPFILDPNDESIMYLAGGTRLWRNRLINAVDAYSVQTNWQSITDSLKGEVISAVAVSKQPANIVYIGTSAGKIYKIPNAKNISSPAPMQNISSSLFPNSSLTGAFISCIAVDHTNADWAIVAFSNYNVQSLFLTTDGGATWVPVGGNLEERSNGTGNGPSVAWVNIALVGGKPWYFAATSVGLFSTNNLDGMNTVWEREGASTIGIMDVRMVDVRKSDGFIVAATHGNGLYASTIVVAPARSNPDSPQLQLLQNYPNPAQAMTSITFFLPQSAHARLVLWNAHGQEVQKIIDAPLPSGEHTIQLNTQLLAAGAYLFRLEANAQSIVRTMIVSH